MMQYLDLSTAPMGSTAWLWWHALASDAQVETCMDARDYRLHGKQMLSHQSLTDFARLTKALCIGNVASRVETLGI